MKRVQKLPYPFAMKNGPHEGHTRRILIPVYSATSAESSGKSGSVTITAAILSLHRRDGNRALLHLTPVAASVVSPHPQPDTVQLAVSDIAVAVCKWDVSP